MPYTAGRVTSRRCTSPETTGPGLRRGPPFEGDEQIGAFVRVVVPLAFISSTAEKTISIGVLTELVGGDVFFWQSLQAAVVFVALPIAFVFNLLLGRFIAGFTMGAVKG